MTRHPLPPESTAYGIQHKVTSDLSVLSGTHVVLGVSGGISAYKAIEVCRRLVDAGAFVSPVLTADALRFVTPLTFSALASEPARVSLWDSAEPSPHTILGQRASLVVVAPATANVIARYATAMSDDLLVATLLATRAPVLLCPAMHTEMWEQPGVAHNVAVLRARGVHVLDPGVGHLAGGDSGKGRLREPAEIVSAAADVLAASAASAAERVVVRDLEGVAVVVTAGGTREPIDPVRFIGNRSSGKQGHAIAVAAHHRGARVVLITTVSLPTPPGVEVIRVDTAEQMHGAVARHAPSARVVVMSAAVADFRPVNVATQKIKKVSGGAEVPEIRLERTPDILATLGAAKPAGQILVGFAAETHDLTANACEKLERKRLDLIVANDVSAPGVGFEHDTNAVTIFGADGSVTELERQSKAAIASSVLDAISVRLAE